MARNVSLGKPSSSIRKKVPPLPLKRLKSGRLSEPRVPPRHRIHRHIRLQPATPLSQRPRVMSSVVLDSLNREPVPGCFRRGVYQRRGARESGVWPHVAAHEVFGLVGPVASFWEGCGGDDGGGVLVLQSPVDEFEVGLVVLSPHVLKRAEGMDQLSERGKESEAPTSNISTLTNASKRPAHSTGISR
jgi:hypothetical protein